VLEITSHTDVTMRQLAKVIRSDAVFSSQVLRLANSALFHCSDRISSLSRALSTLGLERLEGLAVTVATSNYVKKALGIEELRRCWRHTLACAILCRELARAASLSGELGYMLGLLHDIGRLGLLVTYPNDYAQMLREADRDPQSLLDKEQQLFGMDHCEAGRTLAQLWNLPEEFPLILGRHHDPPSGTSLDMLAVVYYGCRLADVLGFAVLKPLKTATVDEIQAALPPQVAGRFTASVEELTEMVEQKIMMHDAGDAAVHIAQSRAPEAASEPEQGTAETPSMMPESAPASAYPGARRRFPAMTPRLAAIFVAAAAVAITAAWLYVSRP